MRGLRFNIPSEYGIYLQHIFKEIIIPRSVWKIDYADAFCKEGLLPLFNNDVLSNNDFIEAIGKDSFVFLLNLRLYYDKEFVNEDIKSYSEFEASNCVLHLSIIDGMFVSIYCKDFSILEIITKNALHYRFTEIEYITEENDLSKEYHFFPLFE